MNKWSIIGFSLLFLPLKANAQILSPRIANYTMEIDLDVEEKMIYGNSIIEWTNPSQDTVSNLQFHLYYNAFKSTQSTFMRDRNQFAFLSKSMEEECKWSYSEVLSLKDSKGIELVDKSAYIAPDDGNDEDETVLQVALENPVLPGETSTFVMNWEARIPKTMVRTGYNQNYYFFAQWFPKLGVYEPAGMRYAEKGGWNCHQYHASGEYYGEFGNYDVSLTVPQNYVVGSSGSLISETIDNGRKTYRFQLNDAIDFTWTCSTEYKKEERKWKDLTILLYYYPGHEKFVDRYFTTAIQALDYMDQYVGDYPYQTLTMVDPPLHGLFSGGMEYPTLITSLSSKLLPRGVKAPETLIVHEFVHQYFMQMVATHEQEEPWLDEGFTTYYEGRILDHYYGKKTSLLDSWGLQMGNGEYNRYEFWSSDNPKIADNTYKARDFVHGGYSEIAYNKTAMMLKTLEGILGREEFDSAMQNYFEQWKFKHPCGLDFIESFKGSIEQATLEGCKFDLDLFFEQALYGSLICDYKVASISHAPLRGKAGFLNSIDSCEVDTGLEEGKLRNLVVLNRIGEMVLPVEVLLTYDDGTEHIFLWDGIDRSTEYEEISTRKITKVQLDPKGKLNLEKNVINNIAMSKTSSSYRKYTSKFKVGMQHLLDFLNFIS